jgi:hypothetical protein
MGAIPFGEQAQAIAFFRKICHIPSFPERGNHMDNSKAPRPRLNLIGRTARTKRIFARMREGWAYDEIARDEGLSAERVRQIVAEVLGKRVIDRGPHPCAPATRTPHAGAEARGRGGRARRDQAIAPLIKVIDRMDRHQETVVAKHYYGPEERQRLLDKLNRVAANLTDAKTTPEAAPAESAEETKSGEPPA